MKHLRSFFVVDWQIRNNWIVFSTLAEFNDGWKMIFMLLFPYIMFESIDSGSLHYVIIIWLWPEDVRHLFQKKKHLLFVKNKQLLSVVNRIFLVDLLPTAPQKKCPISSLRGYYHY